MSEFPRNPNRRQQERQQAIASVISGIASNAQIDPEYTVQEHLEGASQTETPPEEEYQPFQQILPDVAEGFDMNGDYHAVEVQGEYIGDEWEQEIDEYTALRGLGTAITPYRWASYLQDSIQQLAEANDYHTGQAERFDMAIEIVNGRLAQIDSQEEKANLLEALQIWFRSYGGGNGN